MSESGDAAAARPISGWRRFMPSRQWRRRRRFDITLTALIVSFALLVLWRDVVVSLHSGEQGVYWSRFFGGTSDRYFGEGAHLKFPWDEIVVYSTRIEEAHGSTLILTEDGMEVNVAWSARYRVNPSRLPLLHRTLGLNYAGKIVVPEVVSTLREVLGNYSAEEIYSRDEKSLSNELQATAEKGVEGYHPIIFEKVVLLKLDLPPDMAKGIVEKLLAEQRMLSYEYRMQAEEQEKRRKRVEAEGIAAFEQISGISILKWRGIEATETLAQSPNAKIIVMGTGSNELPILLNADQPTTPTSPAAAPAIPLGDGIDTGIGR
jgi:regulator of protease activity HflC (stomatin/prohibitin superfamily)